MRILFVSEVYPSPDKTQYGIFIKQQADALAALGNTVDILVPERCKTNSKIIKSQFDSRDIYAFKYKTFRYEIFSLLAVKPIYKEIEKIIKNNYDLVAVHITSDTILKLITKICNECGIKVVAHYHGLNVWSEYITAHPIRERLYAERRKNILKNVNGIVGVSGKVSDIVRTKLKNIPVTTVYNGVNIEAFSQNKADDGVVRIIGVGNLIEIKGFKYLIDAFSKLCKDFSNIKLEIMGCGVLEEALKIQAKELGIDNFITFHGYQPYDKVASLMGQSDIFALPSFYEALGCVYLEAMSCGLATVGVKGMGIDEIIKDGENGFLAEPKNSQDLYEKLKLLVADKALREKIAKVGKKTASEYTWQASAKALNDFYKSV